MQKLAQLCIRRPVFATMLILALVVIGLDSYRKLGVDYFPKVEFPFVNIQTVLPGASPEEVESQVTKPLEEVINTISGRTYPKIGCRAFFFSHISDWFGVNCPVFYSNIHQTISFRINNISGVFFKSNFSGILNNY